MFTKKQEFELITAIKGRGEIPLKFAYLNEGADNWDKIAQSRSGKDGINKMELELLRKRIADFLSEYSDAKKINVIDIGCGNGIPVYPILEKLKQKNISFRYVPVDISKTILDLAVKNVREKFGNIPCKPIELDFELGNFADIIYELRGSNYSNLMLFLGSTLGNHSDRHRVLTNFRDSMGVEDFLLIGVELTNFSKIDKITSGYQGKVDKDFAYFIPEMIGINRRDTDFKVSWNNTLGQVDVHIILKKDCKIKIGNEQFVLEKGEKLLLVRSVKFTEWNITKLLSDVGFRTELLTTTLNRDYVLSMIQPTRYSI